MIVLHPGWHRFIFRNWGGMASYFFHYLTNAPLSKICEDRERHSYHFLPTRRPLSWYREPTVTKHSFYAQERYVWLQIALVVFHRSTSEYFAGEVKLVAPHYNFPCIGLEDDDLMLMFCDRLRNQNRERFHEMLNTAGRELNRWGKTIRWIQPLSANLEVEPLHDEFPEPMKEAAFEQGFEELVWKAFDHDSLELLFNPTMTDFFAQIHVTDLYRALSERSQV